MKSSITESVSRLFPLGSIPQFVGSFSLKSFCSERRLANHKCVFGDVLCVLHVCEQLPESLNSA